VRAAAVFLMALFLTANDAGAASLDGSYCYSISVGGVPIAAVDLSWQDNGALTGRIKTETIGVYALMSTYDYQAKSVLSRDAEGRLRPAGHEFVLDKGDFRESMSFRYDDRGRLIEVEDFDRDTRYRGEAIISDSADIIAALVELMELARAQRQSGAQASVLHLARGRDTDRIVVRPVGRMKARIGGRERGILRFELDISRERAANEQAEVPPTSMVIDFADAEPPIPVQASYPLPVFSLRFAIEDSGAPGRGCGDGGE